MHRLNEAETACTYRARSSKTGVWWQRSQIALLSILLAACGGGDVSEDLRREPLSATVTAATTQAPVYDRDDLYRFFSIAFGAAPGVTYMGQLVEAAESGMSIKNIVNVFTTKPQFLETYPASLSSREYAQNLVDNVVGTSATAGAKAEAVEDIVAALSLPDWTRGDITYAIFNNLAKKPADDTKWAATAKKMANQVEYAKHFTETMKVDTTDLSQLRAVVKSVTEGSSVNGVELSRIIQQAVDVARAQSPVLAPIARATADRPAVQAGSTVLLSGRTSFAFFGGALTYAWKLESQPAGSSAKLSSATGDQSTFLPDLPGQYVASLVVSDGVTSSRSSRATITALPSGALTTGQTVVASLNTGVCAALTGCAPAVLSDFQLTFNQCSITKVGSSVTVTRPGMDPITADFDGFVNDKASISGQYLIISVTGTRIGSYVDVAIDKSTGAVASAEAVSRREDYTVEGSINCKVETSGTFPEFAAVTSIVTAEDLVKALDPSACRSVSNGASFAECTSAVVRDFTLQVGTCTLTKAGDTLTVSKPGKASISAKLNGDTLDAVGEAGSGGIYQISLVATDNDIKAGTLQSISLTIPKKPQLVVISASDFRKTGSNSFACA